MRFYSYLGLDHKQSIAKAFPDGFVPPQLLAIQGRNALCLKRVRNLRLNDEQFLLVPTAFSLSKEYYSVRLRVSAHQNG